jgi:hypothetical protein
MSKTPLKAAAFLEAMAPATAAEPAAATPVPPPAAPAADHAKSPTRAGLKHIGGYFDRETVEKVAVLRARLNLDNSALLKLAIDELHRKQSAQRAFGDD